MSFALFPFQAEAEWLIILDDPKRTMPTFVSFKNQWEVDGGGGAAVSAETRQNPNPIVQLTELAPEAWDAYDSARAVSTHVCQTIN
jgi:hypothetical protein